MTRYLRMPALVTLAAGQLLFSCSRETKDLPQPQAALGQNANPYEEIGAQHNKGLTYFVDNATSEKAPDQVEPLTLDYCQQLGYDRKELQHDLDNPTLSAIIHSGNTAKGLHEYLLENKKEHEAEYVDKITETIVQAESADDVVKSLSAIEEAVENDKSLDEVGQSALLKGLAVGKSSAQYWFDQYKLGEKGPWKTKFGMTISDGNGPATSSRYPWAGLATADVHGAVAGYEITHTWQGALGGAIVFSGLFVWEHL